MSVNYTVWVIVGQFIFAYKLKWFPIWGFESWRYLLLPVFIGIVSGLGREVRLYRTIILDEMYKDYVKTVLSKGLHPAAILIKHVLRNALIPILTNISMIIPFLFTGSLLLESYFWCSWTWWYQHQRDPCLRYGCCPCCRNNRCFTVYDSEFNN